VDPSPKGNRDEGLTRPVSPSRETGRSGRRTTRASRSLVLSKMRGPSDPGRVALRHRTPATDTVVVHHDQASKRTGLRALIVEWRVPSRERCAAALEAAGFEVTVCPGPSGPDYDCLGGRGLPCPLTAGADVIVLDLRLASDEMDAGVPAWQLADRYREAGKPLVVLAGDDDPVRLVREPGVAVLPRRPDPATLVSAVRGVLAG